MNRALGQAEGGLRKFERSATSMGSMIESAMGRLTVGVGAAAVGLAALTRRSMENIDVLSKQARVAGTSVAAFQAMSLVANEAGVETDALSKMLVKLQDNIVGLSRGGAAAVAMFENLGLSMADLSGLSVDQQFERVAAAISAISDPATKTAAALDVFGKAGAAALNMVDGYSEAVANATAFQEQLGIAISDTDAAAIERASDAVGRMWMAFEGLGNIMAANVAPALEAVANGLIAWIESIFGADSALEDIFGTLERTKAILGEDLWNVLTKNKGAIDANSEALAQLAVAYEPVTDAAMAASNAIYGAVTTLDAWGYADQAAGLASIAAEMRQLAADFREGKVPADEYQARLDELVTRAQELFSQLSASDTVTFGSVISELGALKNALSSAVAIAAKLRGLISMGVPTDFRAMSDERGSDIASMRSGQGGFAGSDFSTSPIPKSAPNNIDAGVVDDVGGGGGGGGGIADKFARRLEVIVDSLKTEREVIEEWYAESAALLQQASDAELEALGGKHEAMERLEEEHQRRLKGIKDMGNGWSVDSVLQGGAEILSAMGSVNKKALKAAGIDSAAQALISTYEGAAKELKNGTFGFSSAAAVISKGLGFVAAIKSAASSGSGGGDVSAASSGRGASDAAAPAYQPASVNISWVGDMTAASMGSLTEKLNKEYRQGYRLNFVQGAG